MPNLPTPDRPSSYDPRKLSLRQLTWEDDNHLEVLTQLNGSVWPRVLPFCLFNVCLTVIIYYLKHYNIVDLSTAPTGHHYMAMVMSFLVVTRVKISYDQYMSQSACLTACYEAVRELVQYSCLITASDKAAAPYRHDVAAASIHLLAVTMQVLEFRSSLYQHQNTKDLKVPEYLKNYTGKDIPEQQTNGYGSAIPAIHASSNGKQVLASNSQEEMTALIEPKPSPSRMHKLEQCCRVPIILAQELRMEIMKHRLLLDNDQQQVVWIQDGTFLHPCNEEMKCLDMVAAYLKGYSGLVKYMTTVRISFFCEQSSGSSAFLFWSVSPTFFNDSLESPLRTLNPLYYCQPLPVSKNERRCLLLVRLLLLCVVV